LEIPTNDIHWKAHVFVEIWFLWLQPKGSYIHECGSNPSQNIAASSLGHFLERVSIELVKESVDQFQ